MSIVTFAVSHTVFEKFDRRGGRETGKGGVGEMGRDRRGRKERRDGEKGERRGSGVRITTHHVVYCFMYSS